MKDIYSLTVRCFWGDEWDSSEEVLKPIYSTNKEQLEKMKDNLEKFFEKKLANDQSISIKVDNISVKDSIRRDDIDSLKKEVKNFMRLGV